jgi:hypothetical protein
MLIPAQQWAIIHEHLKRKRYQSIGYYFSFGLFSYFTLQTCRRLHETLNDVWCGANVSKDILQRVHMGKHVLDDEASRISDWLNFVMSNVTYIQDPAHQHLCNVPEVRNAASEKSSCALYREHMNDCNGSETEKLAKMLILLSRKLSCIINDLFGRS